MPSRAAQPQHVAIEGPAGRLEGLLEVRDEEPDAIALVCHPHPLHQGTMHNKVTFTLARSFYRLGAAAVRFNFRGVGESAGSHADGDGERDDALAVAAWMRSRWPEQPLYLAGFSFGAMIALRSCAALEPAGLVTVAPPIDRIAAGFEHPRCRWLIVQGEDDDVVNPRAVFDWVRELDPQPALIRVPDTGHFFHGRLNVLRDAVMDFFIPRGE